MGMPATSPRIWSVEEVHRLQEEDPSHRYEVVDGRLLVTPAPRRSHQRAIVQLVRWLGDYLSATQSGEVLASPADVYVDGRTSVQPDVFVIPLVNGRPAADSVELDPLLVIEVLSPATARHDRLVKRALYQRKRVEYWIVDLDAQLLERWPPGADQPEIWSQQFTWRLTGAAETLDLDLPGFFATVTGSD